jgi:5-deoxy-glucuronate isomerase
MSIPPIQPSTCIVRKTDARKGRTRALQPGGNAARHLHVGHIILDAEGAAIQVDPGTHETGLVCLKGSAVVTVGAVAFAMKPYDALYVPRVTPFAVAPGNNGCDLAELSAAVEQHYPLTFVSFDTIQKDPGLHFEAGGPGTRRTLNILLGKNVEAGRIMAGVTFSDPGNWTSWPPHEHAVLAEEAYLYIAMPAPAFGVQLVYTNPDEPELATIVREGDLVVMPQGYHPNVAAPGCSIGFLWMMAASREGVDRQFGVVNVQPDFAAGGSGLDKGRADRK